MSSKTLDRRRDPRRRAAVDIALSLAELNAAWGEYERAIEHLDAADQISGGAIRPRYTDRRERWVERVSVPLAL